MTRAAGALVGLVFLLLGGGCAGHGFDVTAAYDYFVTPAPNDAWSRKIRGWQERERSDSMPAVAEAGPGHGAGATGPNLRTKYDSFRAEQRRDQARDLAAWIQAQAPDHYVADGPVDHWATLEETFSRNVEDCDGLELLVYHMLRELGFSDSEVFRSIVVRPSDGQHHMVTLWFEDPRDPWVIDPTGAMTAGMPRMSDVPGWVPLKVFSERRDYTVAPGLTTARR
jgi:hypothetical protein